MRQVSQACLEALQGIEHDCEDESLELMASKDDRVFIWNASELICLNLDATSDDESYDKFTLTDPPMFRVSRLDLSRGGRWLSLSGSHGVSCILLPSRLCPVGRAAGGKHQMSLKTLPIAERFFLCQSKLLLQQVAWHPASASDSHLLVLSSDNFIRVYDLDTRDYSSPVRSITLRNSPLFGHSHYSIKSALGETAVGFSFAPPTGEPSPSDQEWPLFVLLGNGSVFCLMFNILQEKKPHRIMGPISVKHDSTEEFCRILCLHPLISSPPLIVLATQGGSLYHCLILHEESEEDALSQVSEWSASIMNAEDAAFSLHVFESIELELGIMNEDVRKPFDYPIALHPDPTTPGRYFCSHGAGVHCVEVPMIFQLVKMAMNPEDEDVPPGLPSLNGGECIVEHLLCTRMGPNCPPSPILGLSIIYPHTQLLCLLSNFKLETLSLASPQIHCPIPLYTNQTSPSKKITDSPLKKQTNKEPFDEKMKSLLQKSSNHPLIKSALGTHLSPMECLDFLTRSTQVLREENLSRLKLVRSEIELRCRNLKSQKCVQLAMIKKLETDRKELRDKAGLIAERYEDLKDNGNQLISRIETVLQVIQKRLPIFSDAEHSMRKELTNLNKKMKELKLSLDQVKAKDRYQLKQIHKSTIVKDTPHSWRSSGSSRNNNSELGDSQLDNVKTFLQQDSLQITDLVRAINSSKKKLTCF